jgi:hypothetical protein
MTLTKERKLKKGSSGCWLYARGGANVRVDQGEYQAAGRMRDVADEKAEEITVRKLRAAGLTEEALSERLRSEPLRWESPERWAQKPRYSSGDRRAVRPRVRFESLPQAKPHDSSPDTVCARHSEMGLQIRPGGTLYLAPFAKMHRPNSSPTSKNS